jgi:hypothetical protein
MYWVQILILLFLQGAQIIRRSFLARVAVFTYILSIVISIINSTHLSFLQYVSWHAGSLSSLLLPPNRNISYFLEYVGWRFWTPAIISLIVSLAFIWAAKKINIKYEQRFFESEEPYLAGTGIVVLGYPGLLVYLVLFIFLFFVVNLAVTLIKRGGYRVSPYYLWIPASLVAILINELWLSHASWWSQLII